MANHRRIYVLKDLPEETIAVCFAKCSRCPDDFEKIAQELDQDKTQRFHERWVVGYGHSSVAEHAVVHVALENVSRLVVENIQSNRLASYTEKSSRYQIFDKSRYFIPDVIKKDRSVLAIYQEAVNNLFEVYHQAVAPIKGEIEKIFLQAVNEDEKQYEARIHSQYIDVCRMILPCGILSNLGMTANARTYEYAIVKLLSSPLKEAQEVGKQLKKQVLKVCPTLVKYADKNDYCAFINDLDFKIAYQAKPDVILNSFQNPAGKYPQFLKHDFSKQLSQKPVKIVWHDPFANERFIAALLYRFGRGDLQTLFNQVKNWPNDEKIKFIDRILAKMGDHDKPPRELEHIYLTFDCLIDQGGYYDLKRNRMMTQTAQRLTIDSGYVIPKIWVKAGLKEEYTNALEKINTAYQKISRKYPLEASYLVTHAHKRRFLMTMNLRELFYFIPLRASPRGHFSYRRIAMKCYEEAIKIYPDLLKFVKVKNFQSSKEIEREHFYQT